MNLESIEFVSGIVVIEVVGLGLAGTKGIAARVLNAVAEAGINKEMISSGASPVAYYFIVKEKEMNPAIQSIHREFFE